ncbi:hypothetical protein L873DRAFT_162510 [Choiromyces venosus 120613-1]|uniref:Uncharacterized protein n=1 Tax=Choiromyces venosus 120613-1 TaxID=1336337 RepID=A0A3N4KBX4_9PEZI|nr:hypothetical protein L873DRAFT_162510 [Choiromyces venosus 120613-1]
MLFAIVKLCISLLIPTSLYVLGSQIYLLSTVRQLGSLLRTNCALSLTTSILTVLFLAIWFLARTNKSTPLRPPPSGKRLAFLLSLFSTILWIATVLSGVRIAKKQVGCLSASSAASLVMSEENEAWRFGTACRLQRAGVAFAFLGFLGSLIVLGAMVEISDRPFGGVSADERVTAIAEKFWEALVDLRTEGEDREGGEDDKEEV